jgi:hypothetical protein
MNQARAVFIGLAAIVALTVLWVREVQRERQLRAAQGERVMKNLREVLLRENSGAPQPGMLALVDNPLFPAPMPNDKTPHNTDKRTGA